MRIGIQLLVVVLDRQDHCLYGSQPQRQVTLGLLQDISHESVQRS